MTKEELDEQTKEDWRDLGFFYEFDEPSSEWRLIGSRDGLLNFAKLLADYSRDPRYEPVSEHEHYGPYWYLKLITWPEPQITPHAIAGTLDDFAGLSILVEAKLLKGLIGDRIEIDKEYSHSNEAKLVLNIRDDNFDVAQADPLL